MGILEMDFERILGVTFFISSFHSIMLCLKKIKSKRWNNKISRQAKLSNLTKAMISSLSHLWIFKICFWELWNMWIVNSTNACTLIVILHDRRFQLCFDDIHTTQYCCWFMFWYVLESYDVQKVFTGCLHHVYRVIYNIISMT